MRERHVTDDSQARNELESLRRSLATAVHRYHRLYEEHQAVLAEKDDLEAALLTDRVTGVGSRHAGEVALEAAIAQAERHGTALTIACIDLDGFKSVNDTHGHCVGDAALHHAATVISHQLRAGDGLYRWGGDEFLVLLPSTDLEQARVVLDRARTALATSPVPCDAGDERRSVEVRLSYGLAQFDEGEVLHHFVDRSDRAMYRHRTKLRAHTEMRRPA